MKIFDKKVQEKLVKKVMREADIAAKEGNSPFAALLVDYDGNILFKEHNRAKTKMDPTAHAEILLIRKACKKLNTRNLSDYVIVSNIESCSMCSSAIIKAKIKTMIYGADYEDDCNPYIRVMEVKEKCNYELKVINGILEDETRLQMINARKKQS